MGFWKLLEVASMPVLQVLIISILGGFLATERCDVLSADARRHVNKLVFVVLTPSLTFASLAETVTLHDIISWWFMPVNIGLTFLFGGILGWILVKLLKPKPNLEGLVVATCSAGNLGNLPLIIIPAICNQAGSPFGAGSSCSSIGLSYVAFSMALGNLYIWSYTYHLIRTSAKKYEALEAASGSYSKIPNNDFDANEDTNLLKGEDLHQVAVILPPPEPSHEDTEIETVVSESPCSEKPSPDQMTCWGKLSGKLHQMVEELMAPPTIAAILGFILGSIPWLKKLIIGDDAPLRVIQDSIKLLGEGAIPCITLILGGNLTRGSLSAKLKPWIIIGIVFVKYIILPVIGIGVVQAANKLGFLPADPLFHYVLMVQFTLPPAMSIGTMVQLFDVGHQECSVIFLWTYLVAAIALTGWSTAYMYLLS